MVSIRDPAKQPGVDGSSSPRTRRCLRARKQRSRRSRAQSSDTAKDLDLRVRASSRLYRRRKLRASVHASCCVFFHQSSPVAARHSSTSCSMRARRAARTVPWIIITHAAYADLLHRAVPDCTASAARSRAELTGWLNPQSTAPSVAKRFGDTHGHPRSTGPPSGWRRVPRGAGRRN